MKKRQKSMSKRIMFNSMIALLVLAIIMGASAVYAVNRLAKTDSQQMIPLMCEKEASQFDNKLNIVQHSVVMIYQYTRELGELGYYDIYSETFENLVRKMAVSVANQTDGAMAVYFRYNPEVTGDGTSGFFWSKKSEDARFSEEPPTDILAFAEEDIEHVGWFYVPKESGKPLWMTPYYNKNLDVLMISYIIPMYMESGEFIGVIGMDIDFNSILEPVRNDKLYDTGASSLVDLENQIVYSLDANGNVISDVIPEQLVSYLNTFAASNKLSSMKDEEGNSAIGYSRKLKNDMLLYISVPNREINENRNILLWTLVCISAAVTIIASFILWRIVTDMTEPIKKLAKIANKYANGEWDEKYISKTEDELFVLSSSISTMADKTKDYIDKLNSLARTDALTGIGNKTRYLELVEDVVNNRHEKFNEYGLIIFDLNNLKDVNDRYGHEAGDAYITGAVDYICSIFDCSPICRIGGDEFVAILSGTDLENRKELCQRFEDEMKVRFYDGADEYLSISYGLAVNTEDSNDFATLFNTADHRMYEKKMQMKQNLVP